MTTTILKSKILSNKQKVIAKPKIMMYFKRINKDVTRKKQNNNKNK